MHVPEPQSLETNNTLRKCAISSPIVPYYQILVDSQEEW